MLVDPTSRDDYNADVWTHPDMVDLLIRQHIARAEFSSRQSQDVVRLALRIRRDLGLEA